MENISCPLPIDILHYNFSDYEYPGFPTLVRLFTWRDALKVIAYLVVFLLAIGGNTLVMMIVYFNQQLRTTTNFYLVNLAVADVMIAVCCMWVHLVKHFTSPVFVLGSFMCKVDPFIQMTSLTASVLTLTAISCDRFIAVLFPLRAHFTQQKARVIISIVWILAISVSLPFLIHREFNAIKWKDYVEYSCTDIWQAVNTWDNEQQACIISYPAKKIYYTFFSVALFFLPVTIMSFTYSLLVWRLWTSKIPGERSDAALHTQLRAKKKVVKMVFIVLLVFILCWMPLQILILYSIYGHSSQEIGELPKWFQDMQYAAYFIAYSNSAANPVIYCGFNAHFRQGLIAILHCSLIQDFKVRAKRGKSSTMTTNAGSGKLRETPTTLTGANLTVEMSELAPQYHQRPDGGVHSTNLVNNAFRRRSSGDFEEVTLRGYLPSQTLYTVKKECAVYVDPKYCDSVDW